MNHGRATDDVWSIDDLELELRRLPGVRAAGFEEADDLLLVQLHIAEQSGTGARGDRTEQRVVPVSASRIAARHSDRPVAVEIVRWREAPVLPPAVAAPAPGPLPEAPSPPEPPTTPGAEPATAPVQGERAAPVEVDTPPGDVATAPSAEPEPSGRSGTAPAGVNEIARTRLLAVLAFPDTDELEVHLVLDSKRTIGRAPASTGTQGAAQATLDAVRDLGTGLQARVLWSRTLEATDDPARPVVSVALDAGDPRVPVLYGVSAGTSLIDAAARATLDALNRRIGRDH